MSRENDYGWTAHVDQTGTPCVYCGEPSTHTLVVEPDAFSAGELKRRGKRVGVCDEHQRVAQEQSASVTFRRRGDRAVEQLSMDTGDESPNRGNAILGDAA
jgi:hypothetical protein